MTVAELIKELQTYNPSMKVMLYDEDWNRNYDIQIHIDFESSDKHKYSEQIKIVELKPKR